MGGTHRNGESHPRSQWSGAEEVWPGRVEDGFLLWHQKTTVGQSVSQVLAQTTLANISTASEAPGEIQRQS